MNAISVPILLITNRKPSFAIKIVNQINGKRITFFLSKFLRNNMMTLPLKVVNKKSFDLFANPTNEITFMSFLSLLISVINRINEKLNFAISKQFNF